MCFPFLLRVLFQGTREGKGAQDTTLKKSREGGSILLAKKGYKCPVRLFPHGSLKKTLKRKGKHTKTNSYPLKEKKPSWFYEEGIPNLGYAFKIEDP